MRRLSFVLLSLVLAACASGREAASPSVVTAVDQLALQVVSPADAGTSDYRIGPSDRLKVSVFQVPDLSFEQIAVDASGNLQLPLVGSIRAAGLTPAELSTEVERQLGARYLRNPQVSVSVVQAASQKITVDGAVNAPGVYEMRGRTTLMQAVAMASGPIREADLGSVAVFRTIDDRRVVAVFDLAAIRNGQMEDPVLQGDDMVVVDTSRLSSAMREAISILPGLSVFAFL